MGIIYRCKTIIGLNKIIVYNSITFGPTFPTYEAMIHPTEIG